MKQKFSKKWISSIQPRKQRKFRANAPLHIRRKLMGANLSKELRRKYSKRSFPVRKEDSVKIMRGEFKGKTGKVNVVDYKKLRVTVDGINRTKKDGTKLAVYFHPSNLQIKELNLEDVKRKKALERKLTKSKREKEKKETEEVGKPEKKQVKKNKEEKK